MLDLTNCKALVTGASGGIGASIATQLHKAGAFVVLHGTRQERLNELQQELGDNCIAMACDLSVRDNLAAYVKDVEEASGGIDILVNNAGITRDNLSMKMKDDEWDDVINVNLSSIFFLSKALSRFMMKRRYGRIINITSIVGHTGNAGQANYAAAKAGVNGLTKTLAAELAARNITVNAIAPGFIETAMTNDLADEHKEILLQNIPLKRMGVPDDIGHAACYLASREAGYITGTTLHVNGGMAML